MKRKSLILALVLAVAVTGGIYAYTYTTATATIGFTVAGLEIATCNKTETQPDWESVLPGDGEVTQQLDQQMPIFNDKWHDIRENKYRAQSFVAGVTGNLTKVTLYLREVGAPEPLVVELRNCVAQTDKKGDYYAPGGIILASVESSAVTTGQEYEFTFPSPAAVTSGTCYTIVLRQKNDGGNKDNKYQWPETTDDSYPAGNTSKSDDGGTTWKRGGELDDQYFKTYVTVEEAPVIKGDVPEGYLFVVTPHPAYTGDLLIKVYLTNTGALVKAYQYLNMKLYLEGSVEAGETPDYQLLTLQNGEVAFNLEAPYDPPHILEVIGGSYYLISDDPPEDCITPEFYWEVTQR